MVGNRIPPSLEKYIPLVAHIFGVGKLLRHSLVPVPLQRLYDLVEQF